MIITLKGADFSASNIGTLSSWRITRSLGAGSTYEGPTSVDKGASFSAIVTIADGYELGSAGVTVTMGGAVISATSINENVITIAIAEVTGNVVIKVPTVVIGNVDGDATYKTVSGTEIYITDNADSNIENIKMYGKSIDGSANLVDIDNFAWVGTPGFISSSGIWTPTLNHETQKTFAITQMMIPVTAGHTYSFANMPHADEGAVTGIHWFDSSYTGVDTTNTATKQTGWIGRNATARVFSATVTAPEGAAYCELQLADETAKSDGTYYAATTEGLVTSLTNQQTTLYHVGSENMFKVEDFAWVGNPGYLSADGIWTATSNQGGDLPRFSMTNMRIPVIAGHTYSFINLPLPTGGRGGIHWFDSSYTGINTANATTKQQGWISRNCDLNLTSGTFVAPANAAYCELQLADTTVAQGKNATTATLTTTVNNAGIMLYDNITSSMVLLGTLYINNVKTTADAQSVNLQGVAINSETDFVYKKNGVWYVNVSGKDTALSSSLQTALNGLKLSTSTDNYVWGSNDNYLSVTYSNAN